jgi:hypothetical protein
VVGFEELEMCCRIALGLAFLFLSGCVHDLSMHSKDGENFTGRYRFAAGDSGLIQVSGPDNELFSGPFVPISRAKFIDGYREVFGIGSISVSEPEIYDGNPFAGVFGSSSALPDLAHGETFDPLAGKSQATVRGPLVYWSAFLSGERGTRMLCYLIGSSYSGPGFGKCKTDPGHEYTVQF